MSYISTSQRIIFVQPVWDPQPTANFFSELPWGFVCKRRKTAPWSAHVGIEFALQKKRKKKASSEIRNSIIPGRYHEVKIKVLRQLLSILYECMVFNYFFIHTNHCSMSSRSLFRSVFLITLDVLLLSGSSDDYRVRLLLWIEGAKYK